MNSVVPFAIPNAPTPGLLILDTPYSLLHSPFFNSSFAVRICWTAFELSRQQSDQTRRPKTWPEFQEGHLSFLLFGFLCCFHLKHFMAFCFSRRFIMIFMATLTLHSALSLHTRFSSVWVGSVRFLGSFRIHFSGGVLLQQFCCASFFFGYCAYAEQQEEEEEKVEACLQWEVTMHRAVVCLNTENRF